MTVSSPREYTASATLLFRDPGFDQRLFGGTVLGPSNDPAREAATNVRLASLDRIGTTTAIMLGLDRQRVLDSVDVSAQGVSNVVEIAVTDSSPSLAARIANTFAQQYIAFRRDADRAKIDDAQRLVQKRLLELAGDATDRTAIEKTDEQLATLKALQTGNAELVQQARPPRVASSPRPIRNIALAIGFGLVLGVALSILRERFDRRVRSPQDITDVLGIPTLGAIPVDRQLQNLASFVDGGPSRGIEAVRLLQANLRYYNVDRDLKSVVVTSSSPGEGKTTVAWTLAAAAAQSGIKVLLIEADLRAPTLPVKLGLQPQVGLSTVLVGDADVGSAITRLRVGHESAGARMDVLVAGPSPPNPTQLLESARMRTLVEVAEARYELVIIDTPPMAICADAIPLARISSATIVIARIGVTTVDGLSALRAVLSNVDVEPLGVVVNSFTSPASHSYYGYYGAHESVENAAMAGVGAKV